MSPRRSPWIQVLGLFLLATITLFLWRGPDPMITATDIVLHGGCSFLVVLAGNFATRNRQPRVPGSAVFCAVILLGICVEAVQYYLHIDFWAGDIVIDAIGALAGWLVWLLFTGRLSRDPSE